MVQVGLGLLFDQRVQDHQADRWVLGHQVALAVLTAHSVHSVQLVQQVLMIQCHLFSPAGLGLPYHLEDRVVQVAQFHLVHPNRQTVLMDPRSLWLLLVPESQEDL